MANSFYGRTYAFAERTKARGEEVKAEFDALVSGLDAVETETNRAIKMPGGSQELPAVGADRALKVLGFDASGNLEVQSGVGAWKGDWATGQDYKVRDIIVDAAGSVKLDSIYMANTDHTSGVSLAGDIAKFDLMIDLTDAKASESAAAISAAAALVSEGLADAAAAATAADRVQTGLDAAATAADRAQTGLDVAATAADVVSTNADAISTAADAVSTAADAVTTGNNVTLAQSAKSDAEAAQAAAEAALDAFDDRFLGSKSSDPALDNDGNALTDGALYFNTTSNVMKVYDLGTTAWLTIPQTLLSSLSDVTLASVASGEILKWNGTKWVNNTLSEAGIEPADSTILKDADIGSTVAPISSPAFTDNPTAPTQATSTNNTRLATTNFVRNAIATYSPSPTPTASQVGAATAGLAYKAVGSYAASTSTTTKTVGSNYAGSAIGLASGTWKNMGNTYSGSFDYKYLWLRVA